MYNSSKFYTQGSKSYTWAPSPLALSLSRPGTYLSCRTKLGSRLWNREAKAPSFDNSVKIYDKTAIRGF